MVRWTDRTVSVFSVTLFLGSASISAHAPSSARLLLKRHSAMPLPNISSGKSLRCSAICRARAARCRNPAAFGMKVCRYHGAKRPETVNRGGRHWNYQHGEETLEGKAERSARLRELRELEALSFAFGIASGPRWRGRKPRD